MGVVFLLVLNNYILKIYSYYIMGCLLSCLNKKEDESRTTLLTTQPHCFVCNKVFSNMTSYNKHIVNCNRLYKNKN